VPENAHGVPSQRGKTVSIKALSRKAAASPRTARRASPVAVAWKALRSEARLSAIVSRDCAGAGSATVALVGVVLRSRQAVSVPIRTAIDRSLVDIHGDTLDVAGLFPPIAVGPSVPDRAPT